MNISDGLTYLNSKDRLNLISVPRAQHSVLTESVVTTPAPSGAMCVWAQLRGPDKLC